MRRAIDISVIFLLLLFMTFLFSCHSEKKTVKRPNVLFLFVDDLRPELHCYGDTNIHSPNMDRLAKEGMLFTNQYATVPTCGASRYSLLTGLLPRSLQALSNQACRHFIGEAKIHDRPETFIERLRIHGYYTVGIGKISHYADGRLYPYDGTPEGAPLELPHSWDEMLFNPGKWGTGWNAFFGYADGSNRNTKNKKVKPYECGEVSDDGYPDGLTAVLALKKLRELAQRKQPFFLGVGFFKPHLPFTAPKKYWDLYDESIIPLTPSPGIPENVNPSSLNQSGEFNQYKLGEEHPSLTDPVSDAYARKLRHAYYAAISYVDAQVGKVLDELDSLGLADNTIVVLWGDHGWHLGDDLVWGKHTIFEWALRSAFIMRVPGATTHGISCHRVVSAIDIYPTLMDMCDITDTLYTDGESFKTLLDNPGRATWKDVAYSYYRHGITVRTPRYRLTRYFRKEEPLTELYDHRNDPYENVNIAVSRPFLTDSLMTIWKKGNTGLYGTMNY